MSTIHYMTLVGPPINKPWFDFRFPAQMWIYKRLRKQKEHWQRSQCRRNPPSQAERLVAQADQE